MLKKFSEFLAESNFRLDFTPLNWGVEEFDNEMENDKCVPVTLKDSTQGGRASLESNWKLYVMEDLNENWYIKAICIESNNRRHQVGDEIEFELGKETSFNDIDSCLRDELDNQGY